MTEAFYDEDNRPIDEDDDMTLEEPTLVSQCLNCTKDNPNCDECIPF